MSEKRIKRFNLDEGHIWEVIEGLSPYKTTMTLEAVVDLLNSLSEENEQLKKRLYDFEKRKIIEESEID